MLFLCIPCRCVMRNGLMQMLTMGMALSSSVGIRRFLFQ
jgi:hypothetical protein